MTFRRSFILVTFLSMSFFYTAKAATIDVCVLGLDYPMSVDPYYNKTESQRSYEVLKAHCTVTADEKSVQLQKVVWTMSRECSKAPCHYSSEKKLVDLIEEELARAQIIGVLYGLGYSLVNETVLIR